VCGTKQRELVEAAETGYDFRRLDCGRNKEISLKFRSAALAAFIGFGLFGIKIAYAKDSELLSLTMEHFRDSATVADDPIGGVTTISTEKGFVEHKGPMRMVWNDEFLKAAIDKKTGQKSFQIYAWIIYSGSMRSYETASYQGANGSRSVPVTRISKEVANCATGDCTYTERIAFPVDEELLRRLAAGRVPGKPDLWSFNLIPTSGANYAGRLSNAEIAGVLAKADAYTTTLPAVAANAVSASLKLDFGIGGLPVDATAEQPNRAGILIIGVNSGSVAQRSGIIVGDIIYEFDGHPIKALADFQAALARCAANSAVAVKLYRGTDKIALTAQF
jgi:hypothetical protein